MVPSFEAWEPSGWRRVAGMTSMLEGRGGERRGEEGREGRGEEETRSY